MSSRNTDRGDNEMTQKQYDKMYKMWATNFNVDSIFEGDGVKRNWEKTKTKYVM